MTSPAFDGIDLSACDREPIHIPGSIQPHGVLLALAPRSFVIQQVAGDTLGLLGVTQDELRGRPIEAWFGATQTARLRDTLQAQRRLTRALPGFEAVLERDGRRLDATVHESDGIIVLELEPPDAPRQDDALAIVQAMLRHVQAAPTVAIFCAEIATAVRTISGFDRVMVYRFLPDGSGVVEAEARDPDLEPLLGLRFPASDIPRQARDLYLRNWLRLIPDARYVPAPLTPTLNPTTGRPLDLGQSVLRSVSPVHLEYLANLGAAASMSISIVIDGRLWGLVACHHRTPLFVPQRLRTACELFAEVTSFHLETRLTAQALQVRLAARQTLGDLMVRISREHDLAEGLTRCLPELLGTIPADGITLWLSGVATSLGRTPAAGQIADLVVWLNGRAERVFATDRLATQVPLAGAFPEQAAGLLAVSLSNTPRDYLLWFRREVAETVTWAGDPAKPVAAGTPGERLSPRASFTAWREVVRLQSQPWLLADIEAATSVRQALLEVVLRRIDIVAREREEAQRRQDMLMAELDHRVKNMLATIQALVGRSQPGAGTLEGFLDTFEGRLRAMSLAHNLLTQGRWEGADLRALISEELAPYLGGDAPPVVMPAGAPVMLRPKAALAFSLALHELATNATRFGALSVPGGRVQIAWESGPAQGEALVLRWRETGGPPVLPPVQPGSGIALIESLSYELGGSVRLDFSPVGVTCTVTAPPDQFVPAPTSQPVARAAARTMPAALAGARVLVAEDNALVAANIVAGLKLAGASVVGPAPRVPAAVALAETAEIDVAMLDIDLDGSKVWPAAERLARRGIPFLFSTGYQASLVVPPAYRDRAVLNKPFTFREMGTALARLLTERRSRDDTA